MRLTSIGKHVRPSPWAQNSGSTSDRSAADRLAKIAHNS
jgi:hypothetical protein